MAKAQSTRRGFSSAPAGSAHQSCTTSLPGMAPVFFTLAVTVRLPFKWEKSRGRVSKLV